jgi:hypothetical protein
MALSKEISNEIIEVVGEYKIISVKKVTTVLEDSVVVSKSNHRLTYAPDTDVSTLDADVAAIANLVWTQDVKDAYTESLN